jgi:hypothetical protein
MELLDKPLPKPSSEGYAAARLLEALVEAGLALEFLERGLTRNAAGKAFQSWRALLAALLRLEMSKLLELVESEEERRWVREVAVARVPTTRLKPLSRLLARVGYEGVSAWTDKALNLHDYQYNGPDPDMALSKYSSRREAAHDVVELLLQVARLAGSLRGRVEWSADHEEELKELEGRLTLWVRKQ